MGRKTRIQEQLQRNTVALIYRRTVDALERARQDVDALLRELDWSLVHEVETDDDRVVVRRAIG
jgi:hypothetical protein